MLISYLLANSHGNSLLSMFTNYYQGYPHSLSRKERVQRAMIHVGVSVPHLLPSRVTIVINLCS